VVHGVLGDELAGESEPALVEQGVDEETAEGLVAFG
jgi:hypothetical protein